MMEGLLNKADLIIEKSHEVLTEGKCGEFLGQPLFRKLAEIYADEAAKSPRLKGINLTHRLLRELVKKENLNCLIVNLHKGNEGYSLVIKLGEDVETETMRLSYEDEEFLSYIDNEQLPPMLLDLFDESGIEIFYSGCIIAEIRDYRRSIESYESKYILLKPTDQSLISDIASITRNKDWTAREKLLLESEIVLHTAPPLNLSPSPIVAIISNKMHQQKYKFSSVPLRKAARRFSQVAQNRQKRFEDGSAPTSLRLHGFLSDRKDKRPLAKSVSKPFIPIIPEDSPVNPFDGKPKQEVENFYLKLGEEVRKASQPMERPQDTSDNSRVFVEEYTLEIERGHGRVYLTKLTLSQRRTDEIYFGELYVDRDYQEGKQNGSVCRFQLGNLYHVQRYIKQFKEILTEEGRKNVKMWHRVAGQPPRLISGGNRADKNEEIIKQQSQAQLKQGLVTNYHQVASSAATATSNHAVNVINLPQSHSNMFAVVSSPMDAKKTMTVTSSASLSSLLASTNENSQQNSANKYVVAAPQNVNLATLLSNRHEVVSRGATNTQSHSFFNTPVKPSSATTVSASAKLMSPKLAAQLSMPLPSYSQSNQSKNPQITQILHGLTEVNETSIKNDTTASTSSNPNSNLQALLAGSSNENPKNLSRNQTLLERLTAQSVMLNTSNKLSEEKGPSNVLNSSKVHNVLNANNVSLVPNKAPKTPTFKTSSSLPSNSTYNQTAVTASASALIRAEGSGIPPPNINLANITSLPGLNVGLQNLATNIPGIQNVQVSIPGFAVPITLAVNVPGSCAASSSAAIIVTSSPTLNVQSVGGNLFTPVRASQASLQGFTATSVAHALQVAAPQALSNTNEICMSGLSSASQPITQIGSSIVTLTSKASSSNQIPWQLQQKLVAAKRQQQQTPPK